MFVGVERRLDFLIDVDRLETARLGGGEEGDENLVVVVVVVGMFAASVVGEGGGHEGPCGGEKATGVPRSLRTPFMGVGVYGMC